MKKQTFNSIRGHYNQKIARKVLIIHFMDKNP